MLGGLDRPSAGRLMVDGNNLLEISGSKLVEYKRQTVGFVWQNHSRNLIPYLTAIQNVEIPIMLNSGFKRRQRASELLEMVGLSYCRNSRLQELSGGEQQRVAIAIALANQPSLLLADEPTGSVDRKTAGMIFDLLQNLNRELNLTIIIVTHDQYLSRLVNRVVAIRDGRTSSEFLIRQSYAEKFAEMRTRGLAAGNEGNERLHEELAVLDRSGRLQLPREYLDALGIQGRGMLRVELEGDRIVLLPQEKSS
jgi:ABC-type lipoprotein export system ATPase subunit